MPELKSPPGRQVLVIGMDLGAADRSDYRTRGALIVTEGWIDQATEIPSQVGSIWAHASLKERLQAKFGGRIRKLGERNVVCSRSLVGLREFIDLRMPRRDADQNAEVALQVSDPREEQLSELVGLRRTIANLETRLGIANEENERLARLNQALEAGNGTLPLLRKVLTQPTESLEKDTKTIARLEAEIARLEALIRAHKAERVTLGADLRSSKRAQDRLKRDLEDAHEALEGGAKKTMEFERLQTLHSQSGHSELRETLADLRADCSRLEAANAMLQSDLETGRLAHQQSTALLLTEWKRRNQELQTQLDRRLEEVTRLRDRQLELSSDLERVSAEAMGYYRRLHERDQQTSTVIKSKTRTRR